MSQADTKQGRKPATRKASRSSPRAGGDSVTLEDVARLAGVSTITVSRALNHPDKVAANTLGKVNRAINQTGYVPNLLAGGLTPILPPARLAELGYRLAAYPLALLAVAVAAMRAALDELAAGRMPDRQVDFATLRALVGFDAYDRLLDTYAAPSASTPPTPRSPG